MDFKSSFQTNPPQIPTRLTTINHYYNNNNQNNPSAKKKRKVEKLNTTLLKLCGIESEFFNELVDFEKMLDLWTLKRASHILSWQSQNMVYHRKEELTKLTVILEHNYSNQAAFYQTDNADTLISNVSPSWTFRIYGGLHNHNNNNEKKFSSYFSSIFIDFIDSDIPSIEWHNSQDPENQTEGFEIKREGNEDLKMKILLEMYHLPELFEITNQTLIELNKSKISSRPKLVGLVYSYITGMKTPVDENQQYVLDEKFKTIFKKDSITVYEIPELINTVLKPLRPIELYYNLKLSGDPKECALSFDINIHSDEKSIPHLASQKSELEVIENELDKVLEHIGDHSDRRNFLNDFSENPSKVIHSLMSEQIRRASFVTQSGTLRNPEEERKSTFYQHNLFNGVVSKFTKSFLKTKYNLN